MRNTLRLRTGKQATMPVNERAKASNGTMLSSLLTHWQNAESAETKRTHRGALFAGSIRKDVATLDAATRIINACSLMESLSSLRF